MFHVISTICRLALALGLLIAATGAIESAVAQASAPSATESVPDQSSGISTWDLTVEAKDLPVAEPADAF